MYVHGRNGEEILLDLSNVRATDVVIRKLAP